MKKTILLFAFVLQVCLSTLSAATPAMRQLRNFDFDWKFIQSDDPTFSQDSLHGVAFAQPGMDDAAWQDVQLPHDWNIRMKFDRQAGGAAAYLPGSVGWYRKTFRVDAKELRQKQFLIHFEAIFHKSDVYINGHHLGFHPYGFTSIEYDLTPWLLPDKDNVIAVRVNCVGGRPRWYAGSGIYRHAWLKVVSPTRVATYGTYVTTPSVSDGQAELCIATTLERSEQAEGAVSLRHTVFSPDGRRVAATSWLPVAATDTSVSCRLNIATPQRWDIVSPRLYRVQTEVRQGGRLTDTYTTRFGIRTIRFDANEGFFLNGRHLKLQGVCLHQDDGVLGVALTRRSMERRLMALREYGCNAIRCSHNPPATEFLDLCDSLGFVVIDEAFDKWRSGY